MKITKYFQTFTQTITICLRDSKLGEITVSRQQSYDANSMQWEASKINWCACGAQSIDKAEIFIAAMNKAVELAAKMDAGKVTDADLKV